MLIQGSVNTDRTNILTQKYIELIRQGVEPSQILVIVLNSYKKDKFVSAIKNNDDLQKSKIYTFFGLCYNAFLDNWGYISTLINNPNPDEKPNLCGLEVSQYIFKQCIKEADFSDYISKVNLLHQLFRRYSLIVNNGLTPSEIKERSLILNETFADEANKAIEEYKRRTIQYKSFDYLRQMAILPQIYKNTDYFKGIKYLIVDDADEMPYAFWQFVDGITDNLDDYYIGYDKDGSTRCGYLCAYKNGVSDFKAKYSAEEIVLSEKSAYFDFANEFSESIRKNEKYSFNDFKIVSKVKRLDMLKDVLSDVQSLLKKGIKPEEISIVTPICDEVLASFLEESNIKFTILSGSEKLIQNSTIEHILSILKLSYGIELKDFELKSLFINLLNISYKNCYEIIKFYEQNKAIKEIELKSEKDKFALKKLLVIINSLNIGNLKISEKISIVHQNLIKEFNKIIDKTKFDFFIKEAQSFELAFKGENLGREFIIQIENSLISENPSEVISLNKDSILISTPQKIIDYSIQTKYQLWLDISNGEWLKEDTGTIYNAWVFNRDFEGNEFGADQNAILTKDKTARIIRKLVNLAKENISFYISLYDNSNNENFGGLSEFIKKDEVGQKAFSIVPRKDQEPVLNYVKGPMGIMAVPGAGKTTILLALIIKLIKDGILPENIFVLTYMESAAKNFKERIKSALPENIDLPNISTIHGLALRIIKENSNYTKVGLDDKFEICDDVTKEKIIRELFYKLKLDEEKFDNYLKCISIVKLSENNAELYSKFKEIQDFYKFFDEYTKTLKTNNLIDYDDMLSFAVKILEKDKQVLKYYQNLCRYVIEDEAQDSTDIQQKLITLLSGKYKNVVRCGDINQSITGTFTNSNIESFKAFLNKSQKVEMNSSQRCAKPIYELANKLVSTAISIPDKKDAFYSIQMVGTDRNPVCDKQPTFSAFETELDEKLFILSEIQTIFRNKQKASVAILLRLNRQVNEYNEFFLSNGIKTTIRTDSLSQKKIYQIIIAVLKIIENPFDNKNIVNLAEIYKAQDLYPILQQEINALKEMKTPFVNLFLDDIQQQGLAQIYCDVDYWLNQATTAIEVLALNIGSYYAKDSVEKSNTFMISSFVRRLKENNDNISDIIRKIEYAANKPMSAYKFFEDEIQEEEKTINIMTMHKSKGDEFDYVFIPQLNEENYPLSFENIKIKSGGHFVQTIKSNVENTAIKTVDKLKEEQIFENLRLLYVGFTRAKTQLYLSFSKQNKRNKKLKGLGFIENLIK